MPDLSYSNPAKQLPGRRPGEVGGPPLDRRNARTRVGSGDYNNPQPPEMQGNGLSTNHDNDETNVFDGVSPNDYGKTATVEILVSSTERKVKGAYMRFEYWNGSSWVATTVEPRYGGALSMTFNVVLASTPRLSFRTRGMDNMTLPTGTYSYIMKLIVDGKTKAEDSATFDHIEV